MRFLFIVRQKKNVDTFKDVILRLLDGSALVTEAGSLPGAEGMLWLTTLFTALKMPWAPMASCTATDTRCTASNNVANDGPECLEPPDPRDADGEQALAAAQRLAEAVRGIRHGRYMRAGSGHTIERGERLHRFSAQPGDLAFRSESRKCRTGCRIDSHQQLALEETLASDLDLPAEPGRDQQPAAGLDRGRHASLQ